MKIAYIADHSGVGNDDEGAIAHALEVLGHEIVKIQEFSGYGRSRGCDFILLHHHRGRLDKLRKFSLPKVFWGFDLVLHKTFPGRDREHFARLAQIVDIGFCSDARWAQTHEHFYHLFQGADVRYVSYNQREVIHPILFAGMLHRSTVRRDQIDQIQTAFPGKVKVLSQSQDYAYKIAFGHLISQTQIVLALNDPVIANYWSNRVFIVSGYGGLLLHPEVEGIEEYYVPGKEIVLYENTPHLISLIRYYLNAPEEANNIRRSAYARTLKEHTYTHRCEKILKIVKDKLL